MDVLIRPAPHWQTEKIGPAIVHSSGRHEVAAAVAAALLAGGCAAASEAARNAVGHFAMIVVHPGGVFAAVDHCRTIPLFYVPDTAVGNDAIGLHDRYAFADIEPDSALEVAMSGYVTGAHTLFAQMRQLRAGEFLEWDANEGRMRLESFFVYLPSRDLRSDREGLLTDFAAILDRVFTRTIEASAGRRLWLPLSGGYDSRLIAAKLVELGADNVATFSYGPAHNHDAKLAANVAKALGLPWQFIETSRSDMRRFFSSPLRDRFWEFSSQLSSTPNMQDLLPLQRMLDRGLIEPGDMVVNGQTGDFISGGHIPQALADPAAGGAALFQAIIDKHFSLWQSLKTPENMDHLTARLCEDIEASPDRPLPASAAALFERQEFQGRQAKFIINGQRVYEFLELNWRLPFWEQDIIRFWQSVDVPLKLRQSLYRDYLFGWDYRGIFSGIPRQTWHWPGIVMAILPVSRIIRLTAGVEARNRFLKRALYFGQYRHFYAPYRLREFLRYADNLRNPISLHALSWLKVHGVAPARFGLELAV